MAGAGSACGGFSALDDGGIAKIDNFNVTGVDVACHCPDTLILTVRGELPVQALSIGDLVVTKSGDARLEGSKEGLL